MTVINLLTERLPRARFDRIEAPIADCDPYGIDVQLALYACYELHYRGFAGVDPEWEWNPGLLHLRARLEDAFLTAVRREAADAAGGLEGTATAEMGRLAADAAVATGTAGYLRARGTWEQLREFFVHRSLHHLKDGDPHNWTVPGLTGQAGAAAFNGFVARRGTLGHRQLYADLMVAAHLDPGYLAYVDLLPAESLAVVNLMSLFGLHRRHRGAAVGHFAATVFNSARGSRRLLDALDRLDAPEPCRAFYRGQSAADPMREEAVRTEVIANLVRREPDREADVVFGFRAFGVIENRLAAHLMRSWRAGASSLRRPLGRDD